MSRGLKRHTHTRRAYCVPGTVLGALQVFMHFLFTPTMEGKYYSYWPVVWMRSQRSEVACPEVPTKWGSRAGSPLCSQGPSKLLRGSTMPEGGFTGV